MSPGQDGQHPGVEAVPLVAVAVAVLPLERVGPGIAEGEWIPLVVVVRLVPRERVVDLELELGAGRSACSSAVTPLKRDLAVLWTTVSVPIAVARRRGRCPTGAAEHRVVGVEEAGQVIGAGVGGADAGGEAGRDFPLVAHRSGEGPRVLEILVEDENVRAGRAHRAASGAARRRPAAGRGCGVSSLFRKMVCPREPSVLAAARQVESRDPRVVEAGVGPEHLLAVALDVLRDAEPGLEHLVVGRDGAVAGELEGADRLVTVWPMKGA